MSLFKKLFPILVLPLVILFAGFLMVKPANAAKFVMTDYTLAQDETVTENLYVTNTNTEINGFVQGDLGITAPTIKVTGTVTGDVFLFGSDVTFSGNTFGNLYVVGNSVSIQGVVKGNLIVVATIANIDGDIEKDLNMVAMRANVDGTISDDARIVSADGSIESVIQGDLIIIGDSYTVQEDNVTGSIYTQAQIENIAKEQGVDISHDKVSFEISDATVWKTKLFGALFAFCSMSLVGYVLIALTPVKTGKVMTKVIGSTKDLLFSFLIGLGVLVVAPMAILILLLSLVGAPLALLIMGGLFFLTMFGTLWVEAAFGQEVLSWFKVKEYRPFKSLAIGRFITVCVRLIPFFGALYQLVLTSIAVGAFARMKYDYFEKGKKK